MGAAPRSAGFRRVAVLLGLASVAGGAAILWSSAEAPGGLDGARNSLGPWRIRHVALALAALWIAAVALGAAHSDRAVQRVLIATATLVLAWGALELAGFSGLVTISSSGGGQHLEQQGVRRLPHLGESGETREDLAARWGLETPAIPYRFRTDGRGFRNEPDRESADVYCVGDSVLVAGLVPFPDILSAQLEQRLGRTVMNVALVGLSPQEERELFVASNLDLTGRLVLQFVFEGNDLLDSARWRRAAYGSAPKKSWLKRTLAHQLVLRLAEGLQDEAAEVERRTGRIGGTPYLFHWLSNSFRGHEDELEPIAESLARLRRDVEAGGGRFAVVLIPSKIRVLGAFCTFPPGSPIADWRAHCGPLPEFLRAWSERERVSYFDLTPALVESARAGAVPWFPADTHWNAVGHRVAAAALAESDVVRSWRSSSSPR
jgi:hypothetical protein